LERLRETIQALPVFIAAVGWVRKVIATVQIILQNFLSQRQILFGVRQFSFDDTVDHLKGYLGIYLCSSQSVRYIRQHKNVNLMATTFKTMWAWGKPLF